MRVDINRKDTSGTVSKVRYKFWCQKQSAILETLRWETLKWESAMIVRQLVSFNLKVSRHQVNSLHLRTRWTHKMPVLISWICSTIRWTPLLISLQSTKLWQFVRRAENATSTLLYSTSIFLDEHLFWRVCFSIRSEETARCLPDVYLARSRSNKVKQIFNRKTRSYVRVGV